MLAALVSAPIVVYLFGGGVTGSLTARIVAFFATPGQQLLNAALLSGLSVEPIDKLLQLLCAILDARWTPDSLRRHLK